MTTHSSEQNSPLSKFLGDDNITILEGIIPYCNPSIGKILALQIKLLEIQKILSGFNDAPLLSACGFEENAKDMETILRSIRSSVSEEKAKQIDAVLNMLRFSKMYQMYAEITKEHPEFLQGQGQKSSDASSGNNSFDAFADPSLFFLLNSMMNNEDNSNDKLKKVLDIAMSGNNENKDFSEILSSFLKK